MKATFKPLFDYADASPGETLWVRCNYDGEHLKVWGFIPNDSCDLELVANIPADAICPNDVARILDEQTDITEDVGRVPTDEEIRYALNILKAAAEARNEKLKSAYLEYNGARASCSQLFRDMDKIQEIIEERS